jgi:tRNA(fMet)-specific endonuclease VapC
MILLDTDHFSVLTDARHARHASLAARLTEVEEPIAIPVVAVEEQLRAWLAQIRRVRDARQLMQPYDRLVRLIEVLAEWEIARWTEGAADEFSRLRSARVRIGTQDLRIAALAIAGDALLLSANLRDFQQVPGLRAEDWLYA